MVFFAIYAGLVIVECKLFNAKIGDSPSEKKARLSMKSILIVLNWFAVNLWVFLLRKELTMITAWQETSRVELVSWFFHFVEATIVVVDVCVTPCTIWLVDNASVSHHFHSSIVFWCRNRI